MTAIAEPTIAAPPLASPAGRVGFSVDEVAALCDASPSLVRLRLDSHACAHVRLSRDGRPGRVVLLDLDWQTLLPWHRRAWLREDGDGRTTLRRAWRDRVRLTLDEVGAALGCSARTLRRALASDGVTLGRCATIEREALTSWLLDRRVPARWEQKHDARPSRL